MVTHGRAHRSRVVGALLVVLAVGLYACSGEGGPVADFGTERRAMVADQIAARGIEDPRVLTAMEIVPRHLFVPEPFADRAYQDRSIPIGFGQPISQPFVVALMSAKLDSAPGDRVLEIGTGSGYQAAVLAEMGLDVWTMEIIPDLTASADRRLDDLGYTDIEVRTGDGYGGWPEQAPFDRIIVTAAPDHVPEPLLDQLAVGGTLVIPVGAEGAVQALWVFRRNTDGEIESEAVAGVEFIPMTRADG